MAKIDKELVDTFFKYYNEDKTIIILSSEWIPSMLRDLKQPFSILHSPDTITSTVELVKNRILSKFKVVTFLKE